MIILFCKDKLARVTESLDGNKKATQKIHNNDISKRKEVLLLCEKYEQLKKNAKRYLSYIIMRISILNHLLCCYGDY